MACGDVIPSLDQVQSWSPPPPAPPTWASFVASVKAGQSKINGAKKEWVKAIDTFHQGGNSIRKGAELTRGLFEVVLAGKQP